MAECTQPVAGGSVARVRRRDARIIVLQVLVLSLVATLFLRLAWMQLGDSAQYRTAATSNSVPRSGGALAWVDLGSDGPPDGRQ